jgi:RimJ/RimL family protein N-acetyltransferase
MEPLDRLLRSTQTSHAAVDGQPARRPVRVTLEGAYTTLVPLDAATHAADLYGPTHGPGSETLWRYLWDGPFAAEADFRTALERKASTDDPLFFAITEPRSGRALGYASYMRIEPGHRCIEVGGILFAPELQRTAAATEAMYLMARHVFEDLGYRRYEWKCDALNRPSIRAALRLGFTFEGVFRKHMIVKGHNRDTAWFAMLDSQWPARKGAFEGWLAPENFDVEGRQKTALDRSGS